MASWLGRFFRWVLPENLSLSRYSAGRPALAIPFRGFGLGNKIWLQGRVLRDRRIVVKPKDSIWRNLYNNYKRFGTLKISGALLDITLGDNKFQVITDSRGYFNFQGALPHLIIPSNNQWAQCKIHLLGNLGEVFDYRCNGEILMPQNPDFGIISDIDDTILKTGLTSLLKIKAGYLTFAKNAFGRQAFQTVPDFYHALQAGPGGGSKNPVFYVSNSPWHLYDLLSDFLALNDLPKGPLMLRDFSLSRRPSLSLPRNHKPDTISRIIETFPRLPFILIGDSGERDTDVYLDIARKFPGRILGIFIRDVEIPGRALRIRRLIEGAKGEITMFMIKNYREAMDFAREKGWIKAVSG